MSLELAGTIAAALSAICLVLIPLGSSRMWTASIEHPERSVLREAGWTGSLRAWECVRVITIVCGITLAGTVGVAPLGLIGAAVPSLAAMTVAARKREQRARQTVALLQMTLAGLRSGAGLTEALRLAVASEPEVALGPFAASLRSFDLGAPLDVALRGARAQIRDRRLIVGLDALSLCVAEQLPASRCATLVASTIDRLLFEQRIADDVRARTSGLRVQIILLATLVPGLALYLALTVPGMSETLSTPLGRFVLIPLAGILEVIGILASRRVADGIR